MDTRHNFEAVAVELGGELQSVITWKATTSSQARDSSMFVWSTIPLYTRRGLMSYVNQPSKHIYTMLPTFRTHISACGLSVVPVFFAAR